MLEKKGFFRRVFSFGSEADRAGAAAAPAPVPAAEEVSSRLPDEVTPTATVPKAAFEQASDGDAPRSASEMLPAAAQASAPALEPTRETAIPETAASLAPEDIAEPMPAAARVSAAEADAAVVLPADEPEWLSADAPEPEADFSWLDADGPVIDPDASLAEARTNVVASDAAAFDVDGRATAAEIPASSTLVGTSTLGAAPETASEIAGDLTAGGPTPSSDEDFSFLAPDAPLPEVEEEADFSWLEPDAPLPDAPADDTLPAAIGAGAARIVAPDAGFRLREAAALSPAAPAVRIPWFEKLREGLARSSSQLSGSITALFTKRRLDEETLQDFEDVLIQADLGVETALRITDRLSEGRFGKEISGEEVRSILADEVEATLRPVAVPLELDLEKKPHVILVVGVNGTGKTTTIGKLAAKLTRGGLKVTLCAGDTFRAAAVEQLKIWGERTGSTVIAKAIGADAAGLAFEAYDAAVENGSDVLIIDTAGRLQNRTELMAELEKIVRVLQRREPDAPHTVLQTLDATTGQNALNQVEIFRNVAGVNGLVMTKLDGTARGGILVAIAAKFKLPVYFIGVGEGIDDLEPFKARDFAMAIAGRTA